MSHHPWIVPEPFTPEAGELWSKEDIDQWVAAVRRISDEAYSNPEIVLTAPHNQPVAQVRGDWMEDPEKWAMTWRAFVRKHMNPNQAGSDANGDANAVSKESEG